ncbi:MAG: hypothetical protein ACXV8Q_04045 [Methylobacter sp.]
MNIKFQDAEKNLLSTDSIHNISLAPNAVVVKDSNGDLLSWIKCGSKEMAEKVRDELYRIVASAEQGVRTEADWSFFSADNAKKINK